MLTGQHLAHWLRLSDENWMRHVHPCNVWMRYTTLPLLLLSIWSRQWWSWWSIVPGALVLGWWLFYPLVFSTPLTTKSWASKSVLGERVYLQRDQVPLLAIHRSPIPKLLHVAIVIGSLVTLWAAVYYALFVAILSMSLTCLSRSWLLDRMVWLYEDMKHVHDAYAAWEY